MTMTLKRWAGLGLGTAIMSTALIGCTDAERDMDTPTVQQTATPDASEPSHDGMDHGEMGESESGETGHNMDALPREHRLAFMMGHVEAGLSLYRAGEPDMAAPHLLHPVSETHASERQGLDALGFQAELFETVSAALENGTLASDVEPQLQAAEANLRMVADRAGGDPVSIIRFLMDTIVEEYTIALTDGVVTDAGEYQDAYGFAVVAKHRAAALDASMRSEVTVQIDELIAMWPAVGPIPPSNPTPIGQMIAKTSQIQLMLPAKE